MKAKQAWICFVPVAMAVILTVAASAAVTFPDGVVGMFERMDGGYFTLIDEETQDVVTRSARMLDVGDAYIGRDNDRYEVTKIQDDTVYVRNTGKATRQTANVNRFAWIKGLLAQTSRETPTRVALYCTHSDESYIPTSGVSSKEWGDVYGVMDALEKEFESRGFQVDKSSNNHNPHDSQAYVRSRRTATQLLRNRPLVIIDVHRDAVPEDEYLTEVRGTELSAIQLVVGRQNQNRDANLEFAQILKEEADRQYPGLVKGIFDAKGNYNQDLAPRSILLEFGTHETSLDMAEKAADLISDVLPAAAGASKPMSGSGSRSVLWILGLVVLAAIIMVVLNASGWEGVRNFFGREFTSALGIGRKKKAKKPTDKRDPHHDDQNGTDQP
jgi:stage II sporulation protein P